MGIRAGGPGIEQCVCPSYSGGKSGLEGLVGLVQWQAGLLGNLALCTLSLT